MSFDLDWLRTAWTKPVKALEQYGCTSVLNPHWRLVKALSDNNAGPADLAAYFRSIIRWEELNSRRNGFFLEVPADISNQIPRKTLEQATLEHYVSDQNVLVGANAWKPVWLNASSFGYSPDDALATRQKGKVESCDPDPILAHLDLKYYKSKAQRDALRAAICLPPGHTLVVYLPTGSGKTLCAFLPSLLSTSSEFKKLGLTLIVVPTISLALDLERRIAEKVGHPVAYRPGESNVSDIHDRCEAGIQGPLILSPESFLGSMYSSIKRATKNGFLKYIVIDEAHMVLNWGDEFRPAFLQLAAARKELVKLSSKCSTPVRTILMSATFSEYHLKWLKKMFSEEEQFSIIHAARLRPEPSYWQAKASCDDERTAWVLESVFHLPKPLVLYTIKPTESDRWLELLRANGFQRLGIITGKTPEKKRSIEMDRWIANQTDIMVATSAFGLGVDKQDIRSILHAQLPESVDRFYQDVGRSGRDGFGSISMLIWSERDRQTALNLISPKFITGEKGFERWGRMFGKKKVLDKDRNIIEVNLNLGRTIDMQGDYNRLWNVRTLILMQRAGLIEFERTHTDTADKLQLHPLPVQHMEEHTWKIAVDPLRKELNDEYGHSEKLLNRLISPESACLSDVFKECYKSDMFSVPVVGACGGCPYCRKNSIPDSCGMLLSRRTPKIPFPPRTLGNDLQDLLSYSNGCFVFYPYNSIEPRLPDLIRVHLTWLIDQGIINFVGPTVILEELMQICCEGPHRLTFWNSCPPSTQDSIYLQPLALIVSHPLPIWWNRVWNLLENQERTTIIVAPADIRCPNHSGRLIRNVITHPSMNLESWEDNYLA